MRTWNRLGELLVLGSIVTWLALPVTSGAQETYGWTHGLGSKIYFMPGGPRESWLSGCIVQTWLGKEPRADFAILNVYNGSFNGMNTVCDVMNQTNRIQIVTLKNGRLHEGRIATPSRELRNGTYRYASMIASGDTGDPIVGAHVSAINTNGFPMYWDITAF